MLHTVLFVVASFAAACQGRRVHVAAPAAAADPSAADASQKFARFLLAQNPEIAFNPGAHINAGSPTSMRFRQASMQSPSVVGESEKGDAVGEVVGNRKDSGVSYRQQFEDLFSQPLDPSKPVQKPNLEAQKSEPTAKRVPFSDVWGTKCVREIHRFWSTRDKGRLAFFVAIHGLGLVAPLLFFSWKMFAINFVIGIISGLGITYSYHRQLSHRSFKSPKWFEYLWATFGMMGMQGAPLDWASEHRYHHLHTETPLDPHSIYEGFYWSHMGWLLDSEKKEQRCSDMSNAKDMSKQKFYQLTHKYYKLFVLAKFSLVYALGGMAALAWRCLFIALQYHVTWFVNSASHVWGNQEYRTGDQSRNNWWVGILAFGEGWHNNHHAFEYSARHGLRRHQFDLTWMLVRFFQKLGLVTNVKLPTERAMNRLRIKDPEANRDWPDVFGVAQRRAKVA